MLEHALIPREGPGEAEGLPCPACADTLFPWVHAEAADPGRDERYVVARCESCGHAVTLDAESAPSSELHPTGSYAPGAPRLARLAGPVLRRFDAARLRLLEPHLNPGARVLEVGAGRGRFCLRLAERGYVAEGIEPSEHRCAEAQAAGADVRCAGVEDADLAAGEYDAVVAWHVLENLGDPDVALERIAWWLRPGGVVLIGAPNVRSWQAGIGGEHWFHLDVPRHRHHFSSASLPLFCERHGLELVSARRRLAEHNQFGMWQTAVNAVTLHDGVLFGLLRRSLNGHTARGRAQLAIDVLVTALVAIPAALVTVPLEAVAGLVGRGGSIAVVARRAG